MYLGSTILHALFQLDVPVAEKILRALLIYAFLVVALRLAGKREMAQLTPLDFIVLLSVANAVQNGIIGNDNSVLGAVVGATVLFLVNAAMAVSVLRSHRWRKIVEGSPTVLVKDGVVDETALRHEQLSKEDVLAAVEREGARDFAEVSEAILEPNGTIVVVPTVPDYETRHYLALATQLQGVRADLRALADELGAHPAAEQRDPDPMLPLAGCAFESPGADPRGP